MRRSRFLAVAVLLGVLEVSTLARAEPPTPELAAPSGQPSSDVVEPSPPPPRPEVTSTPPSPVPPVQPPPRTVKLRVRLEPPSTVEGYDTTRERLERRVQTTTGDEQRWARSDLAQLERWYGEDVRRSPGMLAAGIVLLCASPALTVGGGMLAVGDLNFSFSGGGGRSDGDRQYAGYAMVLGGLLALAAGIPLTVLGARRVIRTPSEREERNAGRGEAPRPAVSLGFGAGTMALGGSF